MNSNGLFAEIYQSILTHCRARSFHVPLAAGLLLATVAEYQGKKHYAYLHDMKHNPQIHLYQKSLLGLPHIAILFGY